MTVNCISNPFSKITYCIEETYKLLFSVVHCEGYILENIPDEDLGNEWKESVNDYHLM